VTFKRNTLLLAVAAIGIVSAANGQDGRTIYRIDVTAPGTKSQGLRGTLYDDQGRPVEAGPDVETPLGRFGWIECHRLWDSCGRWRIGSPTPMSSYVRQERPASGYRIIREERRDGVHWRGELVGMPATLRPVRRIETPMGIFRWTSGQMGRMHWRGWVPSEWPDLPFVRTDEGRGG
jgi:hypothetical protein